MTVKEYVKKNWKNIAFITAIALLILLNVQQYRSSVSIYKENAAINAKYEGLKNTIDEANKQVAYYKDQVTQKESEIKASKEEISQTEAELKVSQANVKRLSKKILSQGEVKPEDFQAYVDNCDSLAVVAPILSDQVDTLKAQKDVLVKNFEQKSVLQDSIIKKKDGIILDQTAFLNTTMDSYNKSVEKLQVVENKLTKEKKRKGTWKKIAIGLGLGLVGIISLK